MHYTVIEYSSPTIFSEIVNRLINNNYKPLGGISFSIHPETGDKKYVQSLINENIDNIEGIKLCKQIIKDTINDKDNFEGKQNFVFSYIGR